MKARVIALRKADETFILVFWDTPEGRAEAAKQVDKWWESEELNFSWDDALHFSNLLTEELQCR